MVDVPGAASGEIRQRWRIAFARDEPLLGLGQPGIASLWEESFRLAGLPVAMSQARNPRPRLAFAAPLPLGMPAEHELLDAVMGARLTIGTVRERLAGSLPAGLRLVDLFDVWTGEPALPATLAAADYRVPVRGESSGALGEVCQRLLTAPALQRERVKGEGSAIRYDLRPLILSLAVATPAPILRMRLRHAQDGGIGRPDEVLLALEDLLGRQLEVGPTVRERLWTGDELRSV